MRRWTNSKEFQKLLSLAESMALTFHGPARIAYDAWEHGMARAAASVAANDLKSYLSQNLDPAAGFFYTPTYDIQNEPSLGNSTFFPQTANTYNGQTVTMLSQRLEMSGTAWLKCYIEDHNFFVKFNAAYYADTTVSNDTGRLVLLAASVLPNIELQPFATWFEHQYIFDTSVQPGPKVYALGSTFPEANAVSALTVGIIHFNTLPSGDEADIFTSITPLFWDAGYSMITLPQMQLPLSATTGEAVGTGTTETLNGAERIAMDVPIDGVTTRIFLPANAGGTVDRQSDISGVVIGANSGSLTIKTDTGAVSGSIDFKKGAFGANIGGTNAGFSRDVLSLTLPGSTGNLPGSPSNPLMYQRNVYHQPLANNPYASTTTYQLVASPLVPAGQSVVTLSHPFAQGPQMLSIPLRPLQNDLAAALGIPTQKALLAQWRDGSQGASADSPDNYRRYPTLPLYQPGYGLWASFVTNTTSVVVGESQDDQDSVSAALLFGWNQIGSPYSSGPIQASTNVTVQYNGTEDTLSNAILKNGWVQAGIIGFSGGYVDIENSAQATATSVAFDKLVPWQGYWIRVLVPEGVTLTYHNPGAASTAIKQRGTRSTARFTPRPTLQQAGGWMIPLILRDANGNQSVASLGQTPQASDNFTSSLDVSAPPPFPAAGALSVRFPHPNWSARGAAGDFLTDFRKSGVKTVWDVVLSTPQPNQDYTLTWNDVTRIPRGTHLTLVDLDTGLRRSMNSLSSYTFRTGRAVTSRHLQILADPHTTNALMVRDVQVRLPRFVPGRAAASATISYNLSTEADVSISIQFRGRTIRHLLVNQATAAGPTDTVWDGKDDQRQLLRNGAYFVEIAARLQDGTTTRSTQSVTIFN